MKKGENVHEKSNILLILNKALKAVREKDVLVLKELSNKTIHSASIHQDTDSLTVAVLVYSISKIIERTKYQGYKDWPVCEECISSNLGKAIKHLESDQLEDFRADLLEIRKVVTELSGHLKKYIADVFRRAAVNKASRIYEHGISFEQTANLLGITMFELAEYTGRTGISDVNLGVTMSFSERLSRAEEFFG
jgi:hypothetical protein